MSAPDSGLPNAPGQGSLSDLLSEQELQIQDIEEAMSDVDIVEVAEETAGFFESGEYPATIISGLRIYGLDIDSLEEAVDGDEVDEDGVDDAFPDVFDSIDEQSDQRFAVIFDRSVNAILSKVFETILTERPEGSQNIAFAGYLCEFRDALKDLQQRMLGDDEDPDETVLALGRTFGLVAHYFILYNAEEAKLTEQLINNTYRSMYLGEELAIGKSTLTHPDDASSDEIATAVLLKGAIEMYEATDISVSRGAELADMREQEFAQELHARDITVRYGPTDADDLRSGPDL
ncbi:UPF0175 family protein [Halobaculum lipolyticum]|uniref:UPF0175 family protein n=1 Tax=Halobaculum lipolyticum TaxID=3032001 RepID=A0ABD5WC11_9EURY